MGKMKSISIVIPVYNEEQHIAGCLDAIARQAVKPLEVIVVDNNSSDDTAAIAASYPFVKIKYEPRQGVVHARNRGFNAARGDVIGRIDADTLLPENWVETISLIFSGSDAAALSGPVHYYDMAAQPLLKSADLRIRLWLSKRMPDCRFLYGSNMAIRRDAWRRVRSSTCDCSELHEDLDLAIHLAAAGLPIYFAPELCAAVSGRRFACLPKNFMQYMLQSPRTYIRHGRYEHIYMYPVIFWVAICYLPLRMLYRGYDSSQRRFRWQTLLRVALPAARVNPASFVDDI